MNESNVEKNDSLAKREIGNRRQAEWNLDKLQHTFSCGTPAQCFFMEGSGSMWCLGFRDSFPNFQHSLFFLAISGQTTNAILCQLLNAEYYLRFFIFSKYSWFQSFKNRNFEISKVQKMAPMISEISNILKISHSQI